MAIWKGGTGPEFQGLEYYFNPTGGRSIRNRYQGRKAEILAQLPGLENSGSEVAVHKISPGYYELETIEQEVPGVPTWNLRTEVLEKDIFTLPAVAKEMYNAGQGLYRSEIEASVTEAELRTDTIAFAPPDPILGGGTPQAFKVYRDLTRGQTGYEDEYLVLSRRRIITGNPANTSMTIYTQRAVFTTAQLLLPSGVFFSIPDFADLTVVPGTVWGWRLRGQQSEWTGAVVEQCHEFVLAQWSDLPYFPATENFNP